MGQSHRRPWFRPGPVDKPDPESDASKQDKAHEVAGGLVISRGDTPLFLEMTIAPQPGGPGRWPAKRADMESRARECPFR
jgi:hypothetical protein